MTEPGRSTWLQRLARNRSVVAGLALLLAVVLAAAFAWVVATHDPARLDPPKRLLPPSVEHYLGTDEFGRDVWSLVVHGSRVSLLVGLTTMLLTSLGGVVIGLAAGYGRRLDLVLMRVMDGLMAFPAILLAIALMAGGKNVIREAFWVSLFPGLALTLSGLGLNLLGDGLRDTLDPRLRVP